MSERLLLFPSRTSRWERRGRRRGRRPAPPPPRPPARGPDIPPASPREPPPPRPRRPGAGTAVRRPPESAARPRQDAAQEIEEEKRQPSHPVLDVVAQDEKEEGAGAKRHDPRVQEQRDERRGKGYPGKPRPRRQAGKASRQRGGPSPDLGEKVDPDRKPDQQVRHDGERPDFGAGVRQRYHDGKRDRHPRRAHGRTVLPLHPAPHLARQRFPQPGVDLRVFPAGSEPGGDAGRGPARGENP